MSKRLFATLITTFILFSFNIVPANAVTETVSCGSGGTFTIVDNVVTESSPGCADAVNIPSGVLQIDDLVFYERRITSVTIPNTVTAIGASAFESTQLVSLVIPNSVITLGTGVFQNITTLNSVTIGNSITTISDYAFSGTALTSVTIPNSVTRINNRAFYYISSLTSVTIGNSVDVIGPGAFRETGLTEVNIPNSVRTIAGGAFYLNSLLTSVTIGNSVTSIGPEAFFGARLTEVTIPSSVTKIWIGAFYDVITLTSVTFLGNAPEIETDAFTNIGFEAKANVAYNATGFPANGSTWNNLIVNYGSSPAEDSGSSSVNVATFTPQAPKLAGAIFNLKNKNYLSKNAIKTKLSKNKSFKRNPKDLYKYSIFKTSKKTCIMRGNYVMALKKTGSCDLYATRTTPKGAKYKYWVKINYSN
jgi:hypothetical protein